MIKSKFKTPLLEQLGLICQKGDVEYSVFNLTPSIASICVALVPLAILVVAILTGAILLANRFVILLAIPILPVVSSSSICGGRYLSSFLLH